MPVADGMQVVRTARTEQPDVEVIVLTAFGAVATAVEAMKLGAFDYLEKPVESPAAIRALVARALARRVEIVGRREGGGEARDGLRLSWGAPAMGPVVEALGKVARTSSTVLLLGESGTGKEVAARTIHSRGPRAGRPFVAINCAVLSENLLESELFGHEKGAFTGAVVQRKGRVELADGGTFFLDEVAELRPQLQAKLLRVLEERSFERVGGSKPVQVDVRWIAATHRDLRAMAREGTFREDLYHRLAVFPIRLPPLRERREDIVPLARALLGALAITAGRKPLALSAPAEALLERADWSGNVRELRNVLERAVILSDGATIEREHVSIEPSGDALLPEPAGVASLADMERRQIERALASVNGNRREAAQKPGIGLRTLYDKLKRYELK
jgi:DNA-binding NtrC family response regulator